MMKSNSRISLYIGAAAALCVLGVVEPAFAAEAGAEGHGFPWASWVTSLVNFAIFAALIYKFAGGSIQEFFQDRRDTLVEDLEEARRLRQEAEARLEEYSARLDALDDERTQLLEEYHEQGEREKKRIIEDAKRQVAKMREDAEQTIDQDVTKAVADLEKQVVDLAVGLAEKMAAGRLDGPTQQALLDDYVNELSALDGHDASERAA